MDRRSSVFGGPGCRHEPETGSHNAKCDIRTWAFSAQRGPGRPTVVRSNRERTVGNTSARTGKKKEKRNAMDEQTHNSTPLSVSSVAHFLLHHSTRADTDPIRFCWEPYSFRSSAQTQHSIENTESPSPQRVDLKIDTVCRQPADQRGIGIQTLQTSEVIAASSAATYDGCWRSSFLSSRTSSYFRSAILDDQSVIGSPTNRRLEGQILSMAFSGFRRI